MSDASPRLVRRYLRAQRLIHWIGVVTFLALLGSGLVLLWSPLSFLAAGGWSRLVHRLAVIPFLGLPIAYAVLLPREAKHLLVESFTYTRDDWRWLRRMPAYLLGCTRGLPPQGRLNAGQKLHHAGTFLMFATISVSGFVLWLGSGQLGPAGLAVFAMVHDVSMLGLTVLMIGHVYFTMLYDALSAMRTGLVSETYARLEHGKWVEALPPEAFVPAPPSTNGLVEVSGPERSR
jgi:formate dehydrogenase subunit gamma